MGGYSFNNQTFLDHVYLTNLKENETNKTYTKGSEASSYNLRIYFLKM